MRTPLIIRPGTVLPVCLLLLLFSTVPATGQTIDLDLAATVRLAADSSLEAFRVRNLYRTSYWEYRSYKAARLPVVTLNLTPVQYNRDIVKRYLSESNRDVYRSQQSFYSSGNLFLKQNFDLTGGTFYVNSNLSYLRNLGDQTYTQYSSVPVSVGYTQQLIGYNPFRWERKIEPLKFERAQKELIYNIESVSEAATDYFFMLALADAEYKIAQERLESCDTLCRIGEELHALGRLSATDLLTLKLEKINAENDLLGARNTADKSASALATFLNLPAGVSVALRLPDKPHLSSVPVERAIRLARENNPDVLQQKQNLLEAQDKLDKARKQRYFEASIDLSIGFNQVAEEFRRAYVHPMQQDMVSLTVTIPLIDWGIRKGQYNQMKNNLNVVQIENRQQEQSLEEEVVATIRDYTTQLRIVGSAEDAVGLARSVSAETTERFRLGKERIDALFTTIQRQEEATQKYILALHACWKTYYKLRKLTLYDFERNMRIDYTLPDS